MLDNLFGKKFDKKKATLAAGVLAAGLAAAPAQAQEDVSGSGGDTYDYSESVTDSYSVEPSADALGTVDFLNRDFGTSLTPTRGQVENVKTVVDDFVHAHPMTESVQLQPIETPEKDSDNYGGPGGLFVASPLTDLQAAVEAKADKLNAVLLGLLRKELDDRIREQGERK